MKRSRMRPSPLGNLYAGRDTARAVLGRGHRERVEQRYRDYERKRPQTDADRARLERAEAKRERRRGGAS